VNEIEMVPAGDVRRERGYVYWVDRDGNVVRVRRGRMTLDQIAEMCRANARYLNDPGFAELVDQLIDEPYC
jgi:hypothetical protein